MSRLAPTAGIAAAGVALAVLQGVLGVGVAVSPGVLGAGAVVGGALGRRPTVLASGLVLLGWGTAVWLARVGPLPPGQEAPASLVGVAVGLLVAAAVTGRARADALAVGAITLLFGGLSFAAAAAGLSAFNGWRVLTPVALVWALWEATPAAARR